MECSPSGLIRSVRRSRSTSERKRRFDALFAAYSSTSSRTAAGDPVREAMRRTLVAEVFLTAWRRLDEIPQEDMARVWLYATARRVPRTSRIAPPPQGYMNGWRSRRPRPSEHLSAEATLVHEALSKLPRRPGGFVPRGVEGLSRRRSLPFSGAGGSPRGALHRARRRFRTSYEELLARDEAELPGREARATRALLTPVAPMTAIPERGCKKEDHELDRDFRCPVEGEPASPGRLLQSRFRLPPRRCPPGSRPHLIGHPDATVGVVRCCGSPWPARSSPRGSWRLSSHARRPPAAPGSCTQQPPSSGRRP